MYRSSSSFFFSINSEEATNDGIVDYFFRIQEIHFLLLVFFVVVVGQTGRVFKWPKRVGVKCVCPPPKTIWHRCKIQEIQRC
jgi:hypothetical protein